MALYPSHCTVWNNSVSRLLYRRLRRDSDRHSSRGGSGARSRRCGRHDHCLMLGRCHHGVLGASIHHHTVRMRRWVIRGCGRCSGCMWMGMWVYMWVRGMMMCMRVRGTRMLLRGGHHHLSVRANKDHAVRGVRVCHVIRLMVVLRSMDSMGSLLRRMRRLRGGHRHGRRRHG